MHRAFRPFAMGAAALAAALSLGADAEQGAAAYNEVVELDPFKVKGKSGYGYNAARSATGTRTPIPISEIPISIQVVTRQLLEDQAAQGLDDAFRNVSGVVEAGNTLNAQSEVLPFIRGFESPAALRNGMRATGVGAVDLANIDTIEVLKGPASILYGALQPGGVLNYTTKRPSEVAYTRIEQSVGSYDFFRSTIDSTGPLNPEESLLYRVNAAYTNSGSFRDEIDTERFLVAPTIAWRPSGKTDVSFDFSYTKETLPYDTGIPLDADGQPLVEEDTFFGDADLAGRTLEDWFAGYHLNHRINDNVTFRNRLQYHIAEPRNESIRNRGVAGEPGSEAVRQRYQNESRSDEEIQFVADILAQFRTGEAEHTAIVGFDYLDQRLEFDRFRMSIPSVPVSDDPQVDFAPPSGLALSPAFRGRTEWLALYAQDQITLLPDDRLHLLVGGRLDMVEEKDQLRSLSTSNDAFTARIGALYDLNEHVSPYLSATQSFLPNGPTTVDRQGKLLDPETGIQYEAGLKLDLLQQRLLATVSVYEIQKEDVAVFDTAYWQQTGVFAWLPGVDQQSRGFEVDLTGQITDNLSLTANYARTDAEVTADQTNPANVGNGLGNVPDQTLRLWGAYNFEDGPAEGLGLGFGARYEGSRLMQFGPIELDSYTVLDAALWYNFESEDGRSYTARLNISNLADEDYIVRASDASIAHPGAPLSIKATFGVGF